MTPRWCRFDSCSFNSQIDHRFPNLKLAPASRAIAAGNVVKAKTPSVFGVAVPAFIAKTFGVRFEGEKVSDLDDDRMEAMMLELDEECYLGKTGDLEECADFDP